MIVISFANQKGGTGKTTTAVNIAANLAIEGKKTLLVDLDPQSNATMALLNPLEIKEDRSIGSLLMGDAKFKDVLYECSYLKNLHLIPATLALSITELDLTRSLSGTGGIQLKKRLKNAEYDFVICDCPPNFGILTTNGLFASTHMIIPMEPETFAVYGLQMLMTNIVPRIGKLINENLKLLGILLVRVNRIRTLTSNVRFTLRERYGELLFDTEIPIDVRLPESQRKHLPVSLYARRSRAAKAYKSLTAEMLDRLGE